MLTTRGCTWRPERAHRNPLAGFLSSVALGGLLFALRGYRQFISPLLPPSCRFHPSCSVYAQECLCAHGPLAGSWLALRRLCRCHPWSPGGHDPPPGVSSSTPGSSSQEIL